MIQNVKIHQKIAFLTLPLVPLRSELVSATEPYYQAFYYNFSSYRFRFQILEASLQAQNGGV